jgi:hypothetical protein
MGPDLVVFSAISLHFYAASASVRKQWGFRHSARKQRLKGSMKAFSVSLPSQQVF